MVFIRGQREDYDGWEKLGNPGWGYRDVLPAFKRMEDNMAGADEWRGTGGPLSVADVSDRVHPLCADYLAAGVAAGLPRNPRLQRRDAGGGGHLPDHHPQRPARLGGDRLPASGDAAAATSRSSPARR